MKKPDYVTKPPRISLILQHDLVLLAEGNKPDMQVTPDSTLIVPANLVESEKRKKKALEQETCYPIIYDFVVAVSEQARQKGILPGMWVTTRGTINREAFIYKGRELMAVSSFDIIAIDPEFYDKEISDKFDLSLLPAPADAVKMDLTPRLNGGA